MPIKDVGNGIQQFVPDAGPDTIDQLQKQMSLTDLANRIKQAPLDELAKKTDVLLKQNQLEQIPVENAIKGAQLYHSQQEEQRQQAQFFSTQLKDIHQIFAQSPEMGAIALKKNFPGAESVQNKDGSITAMIGKKIFTFDPGNVADPEKKQKIAEGYRKEWTDISKDYGLKSQAYGNLTKSIPLATGAGDVTALYNFIKIIEPGVAGAVKEGEITLAQGTTNMGQQMINLYNKAISENAPVFGPPGSAQRNNFIGAAKNIYDGLRQTTIDRGRFYGDLADSERIGARKVLAPVGDLKFEDIMGAPAQNVAGEPPQQPGMQPANNQGPQQQKRLNPQEAGAVPTGNAPAPAPAKSLNDYTKAALGNLLTTKKARR